MTQMSPFRGGGDCVSQWPG